MSMHRVLSIMCAVLVAIQSNAFTTPFTGSTRALSRMPAVNKRSMTMRVVDITSEDAFDKTINSAGNTLVVVDYSTTWCGPCKVIAPKFEDMSEKYPDAVFLKVSKPLFYKAYSLFRHFVGVVICFQKKDDKKLSYER